MIISQTCKEKILLMIISSLCVFYLSRKLLEINNEDIDKNYNSNVVKCLEKVYNLNIYEKYITSFVVLPKHINVHLNDIGGHGDIKEKLNKYFFNPIKHNSLNDLIQPPNGILFHGPPGTGKTMFAKAIAKEMKGNFISCDSSSFENKYYGETSKLIKGIFSLANKLKPCVIFFDEIDGILGKRNEFDHNISNETKTLFLSEMDGIGGKNKNVIVIGATNRLLHIDNAVKRRMRLHIEVPLPDQIARQCILKKYLKNYEDLDMKQINEDTIGFSGSDLYELCKLAGLEALALKQNEITTENLEIALENLA